VREGKLLRSFSMTFNITSGYALLALQALAFHPVWHWYANRLIDGSDEPWGLLALVTGLVLLISDRGEEPYSQPSLLLPAVLMMLYAVTYSFAPRVVHAAIAVMSIVSTLALIRSCVTIDKRMRYRGRDPFVSGSPPPSLLTLKLQYNSGPAGRRIAFCSEPARDMQTNQCARDGLEVHRDEKMSGNHSGGLLRSGKPFAAPVLGLCLLSVPLIPSLQFYCGYPLRLVSGMLAALLLSMSGLAVSQDGACVRWAGELVVIDAPCSGVRMLWVGLYLACTMAAVLRLSLSRTLLTTAGAVVAVILGNGLRSASLFYLETGIVKMPSWSHDAVGVIVFACTGISIACFAHRMGRRQQCATQSSS